MTTYKGITLTKAQNMANIQYYVVASDNASSNSRIIPYVEIYRGSTGVMETPIEHMQRAAEDEAKRKSS